MIIVKSAMAAAVVTGLLAIACASHAQQQAQLPAAKAAQQPPRIDPQIASKTDLADRFASVKSQYVMLKMTAARLVSAGTTDSAEQRQTRLQLVAAMRSFEYYEAQTQIQRDSLNTLTDLTEAQSMRMKISLDRMARLQTIISSLVKKLSDSGDAVVQNTN